jgi:AmmeMemoRadiSam system protein B
MIRTPAVAGKFYPNSPNQLIQQVQKLVHGENAEPRIPVLACLVPHAGYLYSGHVAASVYARIELPTRVVILGVRHFPHGEEAAILSEGVWRTPLGDARIDSELAGKVSRECPLLREDAVAHQREHSLEVQIPFLQVLHSDFTFVPVALGTSDYDKLVSIGAGLGNVLSVESGVLLLTTSDLNHYEDDATTRRKDALAIEKILQFDSRGLFDVCREEKISMCGLGPTVALLTALDKMGSHRAELVKYATSADVSGDTSAVVGYAGFLFR